MLGSTLLKLPLNESFKVNAIAEKAGIHWETTERFVELIHFVQQRLPVIELRQVDGGKLVTVANMPRIMKYPPDIRVMIRMYLQGITSPSTARAIKEQFFLEDERNAFKRLVNARYIVRSDRGHFLSPLGVSAVMGDIRDFYSEFVKAGPEIGEAIEEIVRISPAASPAAIRARGLFWRGRLKEEGKEETKEGTDAIAKKVRTNG